jgi:hypothetical protein
VSDHVQHRLRGILSPAWRKNETWYAFLSCLIWHQSILEREERKLENPRETTSNMQPTKKGHRLHRSHEKTSKLHERLCIQSMKWSLKTLEDLREQKRRRCLSKISAFLLKERTNARTFLPNWVLFGRNVKDEEGKKPRPTNIMNSIKEENKQWPLEFF